MKKRLLSTLLALCMMLVLLPGTALAEQDGAINGTDLVWSLSDDGMLTISGSGAIPNYSSWDNDRSAPWYPSRNRITSITIGTGVTTIGEYAFRNCNNVTNVIYAGTVNQWTSIGVSWTNFYVLFSAKCRFTYKGSPNTDIIQAGRLATGITWTLDRCGLLTISGSGAIPDYSSWDIDRSVPWIRSCNSVTGVEIGGGITRIGSYTFRNHGNLTHVSLPGSLQSIGEWAFSSKKIRLVHYAGTKELWLKLSINDTNNQSLRAPAVQYKYSAVAVKRYRVTFDANSGTCNALPLYFIPGDSYGLYGTLPVPTRSGYIFSGWYTSKTSGTAITTTDVFNQTKNQTLYARWIADPSVIPNYTIKLDANGGKVSTTSLEVESGSSYSSRLPNPTRSGYKFAGWYTSRNGGTKITSSTKATADRTVYAHWTRVKTYTLTFDANNGEVDLDRKIVRSGSLYGELPTPTRPNYHFKGWYTKKSGGTKVTETTRANLSANQTLFAQWVTSATVKGTPQKGTWKVTVPAYYSLALYTTNSTPKVAATKEMTSYQTITCTQKVTLSNGTVRYYGKVNNKNYWFTYSCEMDV